MTAQSRQSTAFDYLILGVGIVALLLPVFLSNPYYINVAINTVITVIIVLSTNLLVGYGGQFALCGAAFFGIGAYIPGLLAARYGISPWLGLAAGVTVTTLIATIVSFPVARLQGYFLSLATLAFGFSVEIFVRQATEFTGGPYGVSDLPALTLLGVALHGRWYYVFAALILIAVVVFISNIMRSGFGRALLATRDSPVAATASGVDVRQMRMAVFVISADVVAIAGWLQAFLDGTINPQMLNPELSFLWLFMVIVGGLGNAAGVVLGAVVLSIGPNAIGFASVDRTLVVALLMITIALLAPRGLGSLVDMLRKTHVRKSATII